MKLLFYTMLPNTHLAFYLHLDELDPFVRG
jgi:hypothetical protein